MIQGHKALDMDQSSRDPLYLGILENTPVY